MREDNLEGIAGPDVLLRLDHAPLVVVARRQPPCRTRAPSGASVRVRLRAAEELGDLFGIAIEDLRHPEPVVEADERVADDEPALRQVAAIAGQ